MNNAYISKATDISIIARTVYDVVRTRSVSSTGQNRIGGVEQKSDVVATCADHETAVAVVDSVARSEVREDDQRAKTQAFVNAQERVSNRDVAGQGYVTGGLNRL